MDGVGKEELRGKRRRKGSRGSGDTRDKNGTKNHNPSCLEAAERLEVWVPNRGMYGGWV